MIRLTTIRSTIILLALMQPQRTASFPLNNHLSRVLEVKIHGPQSLQSKLPYEYGAYSYRKRIQRPSTIYANKKDDGLVDQIVSPVEKFAQVLATPIEPIALPVLYPLTIILCNIFFNNTTSIILDVIFICVYALIRQLKKIDSDDGDATEEAPILDAILFFGSSASALLISPNGFETRDGFDGIGLLLLTSSGLLGVVAWFGGHTSDEISEEEVDPSKRLMEIFDEKFDRDDSS